MKRALPVVLSRPLIAAMCLLAHQARPQSIVTVAGGGTDDGRSALEAGLHAPWGVVVDRAGNIFFTDTTNFRVRKVSAGNGLITTVAGTGYRGYSGDGGPAISADLDYPRGLSISGSGDLYIADMGNHRIRKLDIRNGSITTVAGAGKDGYSGDGGPATEARLFFPAMAVLGPGGDLYIADRDNHRIRKVTTDGGIISTVAGNGVSGFSGDGGPATAASLSYPSAIGFDTSGNLIIADSVNNRIRLVDAASGTISTIAGTGTRGFSGDGGPATAAAFAVPQGILVDPSGNVFVADSVNERVRRIDAASGSITTVAGNGIPGYSGDGGPATLTGVYRPRGLFIDAPGNLYIGESYSNRVRRVSGEGGIISTVAGCGSWGFAGDGRPATAAGLYQPEGIFVDPAGNLFVADFLSGLVRKVSAATGIISTVAGNAFGGTYSDGIPATQAFLTDPAGVTVDTAGNLFVSDWGNHRVLKVDAVTGVIQTVAGTGIEGFSGDGGPATVAAISHPDGVLLDPSGGILFSDRWNHRVRKVETATGTISTVAGNGSAGYSGDGGPATGAALNYPGGLILDPTGNLLLAETVNHTIRKVSAGSGVITTIAGTGMPGFSGDGGPASEARLNGPYGPALDSPGNLYIADTSNQRVRRVDAASGIITTFAGNGTIGFAGDNGPATAAALSYPYGVAVGPLGEVYIASNHRVQAVFPCAAALGAFDSLQPVDGVLANSSSLNLSWALSLSAFRYDVIVDTAFPPTKVVQPDVNGQVTTISGLPPGQTFYWQIRAKGDPNCPSAAVRASALRRFTTLRPCGFPPAPALTPPRDPGTTTSLAFSPVSGAVSYDLYLGTGPSLPLAAGGLTVPTFTASGLEPGTTYRWRVVARASCNPDFTTSSEESAFAVPGTCTAPGSFSLTQPLEGESAVFPQARLRWGAAEGAGAYDVYLGTSDSPPLYASGVTTNSLPVSLAAGARYRWRVVAHAACTPSLTTESATAAFSTPGSCETPGPPTDLASSREGSSGTGTYTLSWSPVHGVTPGGHYRVEGSTSTNFVEADVIRTAGTSAILMSAGRAPRYHRVIAVTACGNESVPSSPLAVSTRDDPPVIFLVTPPRGTVVRQPRPGTPLPRLDVEVRNVGGSDFAGFFTTAQSTPFFQMSETAISLRKGETRIFFLQFNGVPQDRAGAYEGTLSVVSADPSATQAFPQASVGLTITGTKPSDPDPAGLVTPVFTVDGRPVESVRFAPAVAGEQPLALQVDIRNPGQLPLYLAGDVAPDPWLAPEPGWNGEPIPPGSSRSVKLVPHRIRGEHAGAYPRRSYFTVRTSDGKSARLLVEDTDITAAGPCRSRAALGPSETSLIVPSIVNAQGIGGARFVSKVLITNMGTDAAPVELYYTPDGGGRPVDGYDCSRVLSKALIVPPNDLVALADPVGQLFGVENGSGQLEIRSGRIGQLRIQSVVQSPAATGGSYGFQLPTVKSGDGARPGLPYSIIGVLQNSSFRTNLILTETSGQRSSVTVTLHDRTGSVIGTADRDLLPWAKVQLPISELSGGTELNGGAIEISARDGSAGSVVGLATVIDNRTGDASSFVARPLRSATRSARYAVTSVVYTSVFRSRLEIRNNDSAPAHYKVIYRGSTGTVVSESRMLEPKGEDAWENVLADLLELPSGTFGPLAIEADTPNLQIVSRVYTQSAAGTYGDALEGLALDDPSTTGDSGRILAIDGLEGTAGGERQLGARTNLILSEIAGGGAELEVAIWEKSQRRTAPLSVRRVSMEPYQQRQINDLFGAEGLAVGQRDWLDILCTVRPVSPSTGRVSALATRIDNITNDTTNLVARP